jgi:hypothetical protein
MESNRARATSAGPTRPVNCNRGQQSCAGLNRLIRGGIDEVHPACFAQESRIVTVRLNTGVPGLWSF